MRDKKPNKKVMKQLTMITNGDESNYLISDGVVGKFALHAIANLIEFNGGDVVGIDGEEGIEFYAGEMNVEEFQKDVMFGWGVEVVDNTLWGETA